LAYRNAELFVNLILDGEPVGVPAEPSFYMETSAVGVPRHNVLNKSALL